MQQTFFFDRRYNYTSRQDATYRIEIDTRKQAHFFYQSVTSDAFSKELLTETDNKGLLINYLSILLKSLTDINY
jgi:hypothetical protein